MKLQKSLLALAVLGGLGIGAANAASSTIAVANHLNDPTSGAADLDLTATANTGKIIEAEYRLFANDSASVDHDVSNNPGAPVADRAVVYTPAVALSDGTSLTFTFTGGGLASDPTMFLAVWDDALNAGAGAWVQVGALSDFTQVTAGDSTNYNSVVSFIIDTANMLAAGNYLPTVDQDGTGGAVATPYKTISSNGDPIPAGTMIRIFGASTSFGVASGVGSDLDLPIFVVPSGSANGATVDVQVTDARDNASNPLEAPKTGSATVVELVSGLALTINTKATSTLDVENATASRGGFVVEAGGDTPTVVESEAMISLNNTAEYTWNLANATDTYTLTVDRSEGDQGVTDVELTTLDFTQSGVDTSWSLDSNFAVAAGLDAAGTQKAFEIFVNTTDNATLNAASPSVVSTGDWKVTLTVDPDDDAAALPDVAEFTVAANQTSHVWGINGMQAKVPYVYKVNTASWVSIVKFTNESASGAAADINMDLVVYDATAGASVIPTGNEFTNVPLGTVDSQGQAIFTGTHIVNAVNAMTPNTLDDAKDYHFGITFTVVAPQNSVHMAVQNKSPDSRADAPVLYNINSVCTQTAVNDNDTVAEEGEGVVESCQDSRVWQ